MFQREDLVLESKKVNEYLHHVDIHQYDAKRMFSTFIFNINDISIVMDTGTSDDVRKILRYFKQNNISISSIKYLVPSHYHFDHSGGFWKLYKMVSEENPDVQIITNEKTKGFLNDSEWHMARGRSTFGNLVGEMNPIPDDGFQIISPITDFINFSKSGSLIHIINFNGHRYELGLFNTPGHTPDHVCPAIIKDGRVDFILLGEAGGTLYHSSKLITLPSSMPPVFNYKKYMESLVNIIKLEANSCGFCHFGYLNKEENVKEILLENQSSMKEYRSLIIKLYNEKPETSYIVEKIAPFFKERSDVFTVHPVFKNMIVALVYGMLMDLGYRTSSSKFK
jgi:glyoxylase-like metal-dependent hydrolase (beta-lactamase superfamily II)